MKKWVLFPVLIFGSASAEKGDLSNLSFEYFPSQQAFHLHVTMDLGFPKGSTKLRFTRNCKDEKGTFTVEALKIAESEGLYFGEEDEFQYEPLKDFDLKLLLNNKNQQHQITLNEVEINKESLYGSGAFKCEAGLLKIHTFSSLQSSLGNAVGNQVNIWNNDYELRIPYTDAEFTNNHYSLYFDIEKMDSTERYVYHGIKAHGDTTVLLELQDRLYPVYYNEESHSFKDLNLLPDTLNIFVMHVRDDQSEEWTKTTFDLKNHYFFTVPTSKPDFNRIVQ